MTQLPLVAPMRHAIQLVPHVDVAYQQAVHSLRATTGQHLVVVVAAGGVGVAEHREP